MQDLDRRVTIMGWGSLVFAAVLVVGVFAIDDMGAPYSANLANWLLTALFAGVVAAIAWTTWHDRDLPNKIRPAMLAVGTVPFLLMIAARWINDLTLARAVTVVAAAIVVTAAVFLLRYRYQSSHHAEGALR